MTDKKSAIGIIIHGNQNFADMGPLCERLRARGYGVFLFANAGDAKHEYLSPFLHQEYLFNILYDRIKWHASYEDLAENLRSSGVQAVFTQEDLPFCLAPELFHERSYKIYSIVHSVDNFHMKGRVAGTLDLSIVAYPRYGEYLGWEKGSYAALGLPKYDILSSLDAEEIRKKYGLPERYILFLTPNNSLVHPFVIFRIIRALRKNGYDVVLKGKAPKCHRWWYRLLGRYFLTEQSFFPFITHELVVGSCGVVGFDTTAAEEVLMCQRPLVNFSAKPLREAWIKKNFQQFVPMWASEYCLDLDIRNYHGKNAFRPLPAFRPHFEKKIDYHAIQEMVFTVPGGASDRIIEALLEKSKL